MSIRWVGSVTAAIFRVYVTACTVLHALSLPAASIDPLLDEGPIELNRLTSALKCGNVSRLLSALRPVRTATKVGLSLGPTLPHCWELITAPATKIRERWFESEPLKATLATDAVIGEMASPNTPGSG